MWIQAQQPIAIQNVGGVITRLCVIECDTVSDLPAMSQSGWSFMLGSKAHDISTNAWYSMKSDGTWVLQEPGTAAYTKAEVDAIIAALDAPTAGGSGRYISEIYETDGVIHATPATIQTSVNTSNNAVSSNAVKNYVDDSIQTANAYTDTGVQAAKDDWFLLGTQITAATAHANNLNNYKTPGHYYIASNTAAGNTDNTPVNYAGKLNVELISNATNYIRQTYFANTDSTGLISVRRYKGVDPDTQEDIWSEWITFPTPANTISMAFGTLNATIIPLAGVDLDTLTTPGVWIVSSTDAAKNCAGRPDYANAASKIFRLEVKNMSSTRVFQEMFVYRIGTYEGDFDRYHRMRKTDGTWNDWQHIDTTVVSTYYPSP